MSALVYIAGPYTGDELENVHLATGAQAALMDAGVLAVVPHLSHYAHKRCPRLYEEWMRLCFALVERCDAVLRLPGTSDGADREVTLALQMGTPVFQQEEDVIAWAKGDLAADVGDSL